MIWDRAHHRAIRVAKRAVVAAGVAGLLLAATGSPAPAAVDRTPDRTATFNGTVWATAYVGNVIYVGGDFTAALVAGRMVPRGRLAALDATSGALLSWAPTADARVKAIAASGGSIFVAGEFHTVNGHRRDSLARLDARTGAVHRTFGHSITGSPYALSVGNGRLYLGGSFSAVNGQKRIRLAAFSLTSGALDRGWRPTADDQVETLLATGRKIYVGGKFHRINGAAGTLRLAAVGVASGRLDGTFKPRANVITYSIAAGPNGIVAAHGGLGGKLISYTGTGAPRWITTFDGDPQAVVVMGGTVYVGGHFDNACRSGRTGNQGVCLDGAIPRVKLAAVDTADGDLQSWNARGNGVIGVLTLAANPGLGKIAAGGAFTTINDAVQKRFVQFG